LNSYNNDDLKKEFTKRFPRDTKIGEGFKDKPVPLGQAIKLDVITEWVNRVTKSGRLTLEIKEISELLERSRTGRSRPSGGGSSSSQA
jgi:hypothetical protein